MDIFIYNSISLIDLGRRVFGQSALSPNRPLSPRLSPTILYAYALAILNSFAHNRHCCVMGIRLYLCEQNNASIYAANTMERENNHGKI